MMRQLTLESTTQGTTTCPETSSIINDIEEIVTITTVFSLSAVLSYPPAHIVINEMPMVAGRGSYFTQSSFWPIV
jgi:hypothetical protein